jgi:predicted amidohydrolase
MFFKSFKKIISVGCQRGFHLDCAIKMSNKCKIGVCQLTSNGDKDACLSVCKDLILKAKDEGAKMVFLPESFDYIESSKEASAAKAETLDDNLIKLFRQLASENSIWISLGGFHRQVLFELYFG